MKKINKILLADSYKFSQSVQYPPNSNGYFGYGVARGSHIRGVDWTLFFGLQMFVKEYLLDPITMDDVNEANAIAVATGIPFPRDMFVKIVEKYDGFPPFTIRAVKEGTVVPINNALFTLECTGPDMVDLFSVASFYETALLRAVWYPTTVATVSKAAKNLIWDVLVKTCDDPEAAIGFALNDFGARGVSSTESAAIGGLAHLVNFMGTDNIMGIMAGREYYGCDMAGFSIPASEHSTITSWGRENEVKAYENMIDQFGKPGAIFACVSDSYNIFDACEKLWGTELRDKVISSGARLVVRPDSGDPLGTVIRVVSILDEKFGSTVNNKGFKVLNTVRVIQGDGVNLDSIKSILYALELNGFSAENVAFGMGGGLLQSVNRDTFGFAMKCSAIRIGDEWKDVYKDPVAGGKTSKPGRLVLVKGTMRELSGGAYNDRPAFITITEKEAADRGLSNQLEVVYDRGSILRDQPFDEVRAISNK